MSPWIPVLVTSALGLLGLVLQALMFAFYSGKQAAFAATQKTMVDRLLAKMDANDADAIELAEERGGLIARLQHVERHTSKIDDINAGLINLAASVKASAERGERAHDQVRQDISSLQRQIQALMTGAGGAVVEIRRP